MHYVPILRAKLNMASMQCYHVYNWLHHSFAQQGCTYTEWTGFDGLQIIPESYLHIALSCVCVCVCVCVHATFSM